MSANRPVRVALIGCGAIAPAHVEACASFPGQWEIVALCDIVPEKAEALKARFGLEQVRRRLQTIYGAAATLDLRPAGDSEGGTDAIVTLPA